MKTLVSLFCLLLGTCTTFCQTSAPAIGTFPVSSNAVYTHNLLRVQGGKATAHLIENVPNATQVIVSSTIHNLNTGLSPTTMRSQIQNIGWYTANLALSVPVMNKSNVFDIRITVSDTNDVERLITAVSFRLEKNPITQFWRFPSENTPGTLPVDLIKVGPDSYAPQTVTFNDYADMTDVTMRFTDAQGVFIRSGSILRNNMRVITWYAPAYGYDAGFSIKGEKDAFDNREPTTKLHIPLASLEGKYGEIVITRTNAFGAFVERYRIEDGSRIIAPTSLTLAITNTMPTLNILSEPRSRVAIQYAVSSTGPWITATNMTVMPNGTCTHACTSTMQDKLRFYRLLHW